MASSASDRGAYRPVIGLTTYRERAVMLVWDCEFAALHASYVDAVDGAGATAVLLPPQHGPVGGVLDRVDGLVLTGGADIDPALYGESPIPATSPPRSLRDRWETALVREALHRDLPLLAVCRGLQVLNVALGGTLHQHLPDRVGSDRHQPAPGVFGTHEVDLEPGTVVAGLLGARASVSCHHHQAIARLAPRLCVSGRAADGTIEAVDVPGATFAVGVQWHPEQRGEDLRLFTGLVAAARRGGRVAGGVP